MDKVFYKSLAMALVIGASLACHGAVENDPAVARYHFVGTSQLTAPSYDHVRKLLAQPSSVEFRNLVLNRYAGQIATAISPSKGQGTGELVRPLLDDLLANESAGAFAAPETPSFVVAVRLTKERAVAWIEAVEKLVQTPNALRVQQEGDWLIIARGDALKDVESKFGNDLKRNHRPVPVLKDTVLEATIDWPRLENLPALASLPFKPAVLHVQVTAKADHFRTEIHAHYPEPIAWKSQPWKLPTETIRDPLVSFSAGQNAAAFMKPSQLAERIGENPFTNQFFIWANLNVPFETAALFPMKNAQRHLQSIGRELPSTFNAELSKTYNGQLKWLEKTNELIWQGVPILVPFVQAIREKAGEFLLAGTFVHLPGGPAAPPEMWSQFKGRNDLVYYDWEISGPRLLQWRMVSPLLPIFPIERKDDTSFHGKDALNSHAPGAVVERWLTGVSAALTPSTNNVANCNAITEVTRKSASDYTMVRSSQTGFTAIELLFLSHWMADVPLPEVPRSSTPVPDLPKRKKSGK